MGKILRVCAVGLLGGVFSLVARPASATPIGLLSFQEFLAGPGGVNVFDVQNLTGAFGLPDDFPVVDALTLLDTTLSLVAADGGTTLLSLGAVGPGPLLADDGNPLTILQFPDTVQFTSATLTAQLSQLQFQLADGTLFEAASNQVVATLLPTVGNTFLASFDLAVIDVEGAPVVLPNPIPEPSTMVLLGSGVLGLLARRARQRRGVAASATIGPASSTSG